MNKVMLSVVLIFFLSTANDAVAATIQPDGYTKALLSLAVETAAFVPIQGAQVKENIDADAGNLDWITVLAVIGAALFVYLLNKKKKQQFD